MVRTLFVSSLLFYSTVVCSQTPAMFWSSEPRSYGTEIDAVVTVAKTYKVELPTEYTLRSLQRLIDDLKTAGHWTNIKVLHCFEHDGGLAFSKINLKAPVDTFGLFQNNGSGQYGNKDIDFLRNVGIRNYINSYQYYTLPQIEPYETIGVVLDGNSMLSTATGPIIGTYSTAALKNVSIQSRHTLLNKLSTEGVFRGIKHSDYISPSSMLASTNLGSNTLTRTLSLTRLNQASSNLGLGVNGSITNTTSTLYDPTSEVVFYTLMGYISTSADFTFDTYSGINYIKFVWISTTSVRSVELHTHFENYSSWIPN